MRNIVKNIFQNKSLSAFATMRTGLTLLALVICLSVIGTLIPQEREIAAAGPVLRCFYATLGFGDLYHSRWFSALLFLLCLNVACCSLSRLPALWRETFAPPRWPEAAGWQREYRLAMPADQAGRLMKQCLEHRGFRVWDLGGNRLYARKGQLAPWGTVLVHASILIIALGALYGSLSGFRYSIRLAPGEAVTIGTGAHRGIGPPFELRLNGFTTEYYPNGQVSDWISDLAVARSGEDLLRRQVRVNHPLSYQDMSFYQMSYASLYEVEQRDAGRSRRKNRVEEKQPVILDERQGIAVVPLKYLPDFDPRRPMVSRSARPLNPHVVYGVYDGGRPVGMNAIPVGKPLTFPGAPGELVFSAVTEATVLDVKHDPGLPLVFTGFAAMGGAFFLSLCPRRRVVWAAATQDGDSAVLTAAMGRRSHLLTEELSRLCQSLEATGRGYSSKEVANA